MTFAQNLIYIRQHHGVTQETLAEQIGVSRQTISKWESGINFPETDKLLLLCDLYNTNLDDLMRGSVEVGSPATRGDKRNRLMAVSCGIIMLLATLVYLLFGYLGGSMPFSGAGFSSSGFMYSWIAYPVAAILCGIAVIIIGALYKSDEETPVELRCGDPRARVDRVRSADVNSTYGEVSKSDEKNENKR